MEHTMKRITIEYRMTRGSETCITCITVPMADYHADVLLESQEDSALVGCGAVWSLLEELAYLAGYSKPEFIRAREAAA